MSKIIQNFYHHRGYWNPAKNGNYYIGTGSHNDYQNGAEGGRTVHPPIACSLVRIEARAQVNGTLGTSEDCNIKFVTNSAVETQLTTIKLNATENVAAADVNIAMDVIETYSLKLETPNFVTNPTSVRIVYTLVFEWTDGTNRHFYERYWPNDVVSLAPEAEYWFGANPQNTLDATPADVHAASVARDCSLVGASLYARHLTGSVDADNVELWLVKNGGLDEVLITDSWTWDQSANGNNLVVSGLDYALTTSDQFSLKLLTPTWATAAPTTVYVSVSLLFKYTT